MTVSKTRPDAKTDAAELAEGQLDEVSGGVPAVQTDPNLKQNAMNKIANAEDAYARG